MFSKKVLGLSVAIAAAGLSTATQAEEVNLLIKGVVDTHSQQNGGEEVSFYLTYDDSAPQINPGDPNYSVYEMRSSVMTKVVIGDTTYYPEVYQGQNEELRVELMRDQGPDGQDSFIVNTNTAYRAAGARMDAHNSHLLLRHLHMDVGDITSDALPSADDFKDIMPRYSAFELEQNEPLSVNITGVYEQPTLGCSRQITYDVTGEYPNQNITPDNPSQMLTVTAQLTMTPSQIINHNNYGYYEDFGPSSRMSVTVDGVTVETAPYDFNNMYSEASLFMDANFDYFRVDSGPRTLTNGQPGGNIALEMHQRLMDPMTLPAIIPEVLKRSDFQHANLLVDIPGSQHIHADVTDIKVTKGACNVKPSLSFSFANTDMEPFENHVTHMSDRAVVPSKGGNFFVTRELVNNTDANQKVRRWYELVMPNGQRFPHGGAKTYTVSTEAPTQEVDAKMYINKHWPDGIYTYKMYSLGFKDLVPEESEITFRKGNLHDQF